MTRVERVVRVAQAAAVWACVLASCVLIAASMAAGFLGDWTAAARFGWRAVLCAVLARMWERWAAAW